MTDMSTLLGYCLLRWSTGLFMRLRNTMESQSCWRFWAGKWKKLLSVGRELMCDLELCSAFEPRLSISYISTRIYVWDLA